MLSGSTDQLCETRAIAASGDGAIHAERPRIDYPGSFCLIESRTQKDGSVSLGQ